MLIDALEYGAMPTETKDLALTTIIFSTMAAMGRKAGKKGAHTFGTSLNSLREQPPNIAKKEKPRVRPTADIVVVVGIVSTVVVDCSRPGPTRVFNGSPNLCAALPAMVA